MILLYPSCIEKRTLTRSDRNKTSLTIPFHEVIVSLIMYNLLAGTSANKWFQLPIFLFFLPPFMKLRYLHLSVQQNDRSRSHNSVLVFCCSYIKRTSGCGHTVWCSGHAKSASYSLDGIADKGWTTLGCSVRVCDRRLI